MKKIKLLILKENINFPNFGAMPKKPYGSNTLVLIF
jgi:hypothetical protein